MSGTPNTGWDEGSPPITESAGLGQARIQSIKTSVRAALDAEHIFPSIGGTMGAHRLGSARAFSGTQSLVSSADTDGRLYIASDTSRLFGVGSAGTMYLGGSRVISAGSFPTGGQRFYWSDEFGQGITNSSGSTVITFPNSGFSGLPFLQAAVISSAVPGVNATLQFIPVDGATAICIAINPAAGSVLSGVTFHWQSRGTRTF